MNKHEFINCLAKRSKMSKMESEKTLNMVLDCMVEAVAKEGKLKLVGFGTFEAKRHKGRKCKGIGNENEYCIPDMVMPKFKPGKPFKDAVSRDFIRM